MEKYGFVYIWYDRKHKRYYVGCHWGSIDDGYICSSRWMRKSFRRRPNDFKRRILRTNIITKQETFMIEQYYFDMIKSEEIRIKYYNLSLNSYGSDKKTDEERLSINKKISNSHKDKKHSEETKQKISKTKKINKTHTGENNHMFGKHHSEETLAKMRGPRPHRIGKLHSEESKQKMRESSYGKKHSDESKKKMRESARIRWHGDNCKL